MKKQTVSSLKRRVWEVFSIYIRRRDCLRATGSPDYGECISCGQPFEFHQLQAGHFIPGRHNANLFSERGVHAQCARCNGVLSGNVLEYRRQIIKLYGEGADEELEAEARQIKKFTVGELEELLIYYQNKIKEQIDD